MEQVAFQGSATSTSFAPLKAVDQTDQMREQLAQRLQWMREDQGIINDSRRDVASAMAEQNRLNQMNREVDLQGLASLSKTLTDSVVKYREAKDKADFEEYYSKAYLDGLAPDDQLKWDAEEARLNQIDDAHQKVGDAMQSQGASFTVVNRWRQLSGRKQLAYATAIAEQAGQNWGLTLDRLLKEDNETQIVIGDRTFTPSEAKTPEEVAAATTQLRMQFMRANGLLAFKPELLNKYAWKTMREDESRVLASRTAQYEKEQQGILQDEAIGSFESSVSIDPTGAFNKAIQDLTRTGVDRGTARKEIMSRITDTESLYAIRDSESWVAGKTWGDLYRTEFDEADRRIKRQAFADYDDDQKALQIEAKQVADEIISTWQETPPSEEDIENAISTMSDNFGGYIDPRLERWRSRSTDATLEDRLNLEFDRLERAGRLTKALLDDPSVPRTVRDKWLPFAQKQDQGRRDVPEFKQFNKAIEDGILSIAKASNLDSVTLPSVRLAVADAQQRFQADFMRRITAGESPESAAKNSAAIILKDIESGVAAEGKTSSGRYQYDEEKGGFTYILGQLPKAGNAQISSANAANFLNAISNKIKGGGAASLDRFALIPKATLEDAVKNAGNPGYEVPALANYISDKFGGRISPYEVLLRQARAQGLGDIPVPDVMREAQKTINPRFAQLLTYRPTIRRIDRAMVSGANFNPALIPKGYGKYIQEASKRYKIPPGLLAGLIEQESTWNPTAANGIHIGLGQFKPDTAAEFGVNRTDPKSSILGAAKYLDYLRKYFKGSINMAIYAYNGGMGNVERLGGPIPGNKENQEYLTKVLQRAAKYGYGNSSNPFRNGAVMNGSLRRFYEVGDIGSPGAVHADVKPVIPGTTTTTPSIRYKKGTLDPYIKVKVNGKFVPISQGFPTTDDDTAHRKRDSFGHDYAWPWSGADKGLFLTGGARMVAVIPTAWGDKAIIELPDKRRFSIIHGRASRI